MAGTLIYGADGFLPVETGGEIVAFEVIAAGEPQESGFHGGEELHDILSVAVGCVVVGRGKQGYEVEPIGPGVGGCNDKACICGWLDVWGGGQGQVILLPMAADGLTLCAGVD